MTDDNGSLLGQEVRPLARVAVYVPGGRAAYPSTVLMTVVPARVAGVREIVLLSPPAADKSLDAAVLVAARIAGVTEAYRIGGAQAVAAAAYGTETIRRVDKIVGPGNIYVALAKSQVYGDVGIDMIAGPSEVVVVADAGADPSFVAADLLAQSEHDPMARAVLLTPSASLIERVALETERQLDALPRRALAARALADNGALVLTASLEEAIRVANALAPEHLELLVADPRAWLPSVHERGRGVPRLLHAGSGGRLRRGPESRAADGRHRPLRLGAQHRGLRQAHERHRVLGPGARGGPAPRGGAEPSRGTPRPWCGRGRARHGNGRERMKRGTHVTEPEIPRQGRVERNTKETQIVLQLDIDGAGPARWRRAFRSSATCWRPGPSTG